MATLEFDPATIPARVGFDQLPEAFRDLKSRKQWVGWKYVMTDGKLAKRPMCAHANFFGSHSSPHTWGTYEQAVRSAIRFNWDGVGYVLTADDDITGADLDKCRDPETGDIDEWARDIIQLAETYTEVSPSGHGLRLFWRGKADRALKCDPQHVEVYISHRYLTTTGDHVAGTPNEIRPAPKTEAALKSRVDLFKISQEQSRAPLQPANLSAVRLPTIDRPSEFFRRVNQSALSNLPSWVPSLFSGAKFQPTTKAYRVTSKELSRDLEEDLSISPDGIVDFGVADMGDGRQGKRTAIDLVIEFGGAPDAPKAAFWLCDRLGTSPQSLGWEDESRNDALGADLAQQILTLDAPITGPGTLLDQLPFANEADWTRPVGLLADMADWILLSSRRPNRPLAVASALSILSAVCGRHLFGPTGTALNVYIACLAGTAIGKNRPLAAVAEILRAAKLDQLQTTAKGFSVSAVEQMVIDNPCCVATVDEIGANLLGRMSHKNSNTHELAMRGALLELWSREQGMPPFATHRRAGSASVPVPSPSISIFGVSTPEAFYGAVTSGSVKDGFLNRFLIAHAAPRAKPIEVSEEARKVPQRLIGALLDIIPEVDGDRVAKNLGVFSLTFEPAGHRIPWDSAKTREAAEQFEEHILALMDANPDPAPLMGRIYEYSIRLAALHAVSRAGRRASVTKADLAWGASWAIQSARAMIDGALSLMAANDYEQKFNALRNAIQESREIGQAALLRKVRFVNKRERDDILNHLKQGGWIVETKIETKGRYALGYRWVG